MKAYEIEFGIPLDRDFGTILNMLQRGSLLLTLRCRLASANFAKLSAPCWYVASICRTDATQTFRKSALTKPHGHHWCRTMTSPLHTANYARMTLRLGRMIVRL